MAEWRSFTVGDSGQPEAPIGEVDEVAAKWGTQIEEFSLDRAEAIVKGDGLPYGRADFLVVTEIDGQRIQIHHEPQDCPWIQVEARLAIDPAAKDLGDEGLQEIVNQWNSGHLEPTVFAVPISQDHAIVMTCRFYVEHGVSDRQLHSMFRRSFIVTRQACREIPEMIEAALKS